MESIPQCLDCIERAAERIFSIVKIQDDEKRIGMEKVKDYLNNADTKLTPMEVSFGMNEIIREVTSIHDPFKYIKEESNNNAKKLVNRSIKIIEESSEPLYDAMKIAIAGNIIDYGMKSDYNLSRTLEEVLTKQPFINDYNLLKERIAKAETLTFLADNAGEIVFDKLLLEQINKMFDIKEIKLIVKKHPFMNDVILKDLEGLGFEEIQNVEIIALDNLTSNNYCKLIEPYIDQADVVIAKGQGNFELLYDRKLELFFLFMVKCVVVKDILGSEEEDVIIAFH